MQQQAAYDLNEFMPHKPRQRGLRVAKPVKKRERLRREWLKIVRIVMVAAVFVALIASVLQAQITSMELTDQINTEKDNLATLQNEYAYLTNEAEMKLNSSDVVSYAQQLGLYEPEQSQITYVNRDADESITLPKTGFEQTLNQVAMGAMSIMEYLEQ